MKKFLLSLVALLGVMNANAQVTETDLTAYEDVIYAQPTTVLLSDVSKVLALPINMKSHTSVTGTDFFISVPEGAEITGTKGLSTDRYIEDATHQVQIAIWAGNYLTNDENPDKTKYHVVSTIVSSNGKASTADDYETYGFEPGDGELGYLYLDISNLGVGEYPLIITSQDISGFFDSTPDAKITEQIVTKLIITNTIILDENSTTVPDMAENVNVLVKRTIKADTWSTICLPFAMTEEQISTAFGEGVQIADFTGCEESGADGDYAASVKVKFSTVTEMEANHPYLIKVQTAISHDVGFTVENVTITPEDDPAIEQNKTKIGKYYYYNSFYGTYVANTTIDAGSVILSGNKFYVTQGTTTKGYRGWFVFDVSQIQDIAAVTEGGGIKMFIDDDPTAIESIDGEPINVEGMYDMSGRKLNTQPKTKGVYIIDGKKVAIK